MWRHSHPYIGTAYFVETQSPCGDTVHLWRTSPSCGDTSISWGHSPLCGDTPTLWGHNPPCVGTVNLVETQSILYRPNLFRGDTVPLWRHSHLVETRPPPGLICLKYNFSHDQICTAQFYHRDNKVPLLVYQLAYLALPACLLLLWSVL